ncbi:ABC transporter ATP-binding protein [Xylanibacillus composti]|uniref:ABC transporter ATP-binding protein n=1 Tax=Xylanibacillus composti TaxID=1572762 RepID=A0A8J4M0Y7_9BACL|nr:ABC transporter ATP-binding protein [Xylanibacillus composti]MDT9725130.1 ABC transporter ATP-binding protein [Xylanibacillus composti]GIQ67297.1 ABC transporter ATP-binding protein [Xylanibacillus composti]
MNMIKWTRYLLTGNLIITLGLISLIACFPVLEWIKFTQTQLFFDSITGTANTLVWIALILAAVQIADMSLHRVKGMLNERFSLKIGHKLQEYVLSLVEKTNSITTLESPKYREDLNILNNNISKTSEFINALITIVHQLVVVIIYVYLIQQFSWLVILVVFSFALPSVIYALNVANRNDRHFHANSQLQLEGNNIYGLLTHPYVQKELIIFSSRKFLMKKWKDAAYRLVNNNSKLLIKNANVGIAVDIFSPIGFLVAQMILIQKLMNQSITLGDYIAVTTSIAMLEGSLKTILLSTNIFKNYDLLVKRIKHFHTEYVENNNRKNTVLSCPEIKEMRVSNLSFTYPLQSAAVLRNINLKINKGDVVAIVGDNGSGKSTLAKIVAGLHTVPDGHLFINGIDMNDLDSKEYYTQIAVVNQDFVKYPLTIYENISMNEVGASDKNKLDLFVNKYPMLVPEQLRANMDVYIGADYLHSNQLSGGQWQRIAIARALYKDSPLLLLDEATSEVDPQTEADIVSLLLQDRKGKTTIIVTHNLYLTRQANQIIVMHKGEIMESGTFADLVNKGGKFYRMWASQNEAKMTTVAGMGAG